MPTIVSKSLPYFKGNSQLLAENALHGSDAPQRIGPSEAAAKAHLLTPIELNALCNELFRFMDELCRRFRFHESAVADAMVAAVKHGYLDENGFKGLDNWKRWFYVTSRRLSLNVAKREQIFQPFLDDPIIRPTDELERREVAEAVQSAINQLDSSLREVFVFCIVDGHSRSEAATHFGVTLYTVNGRLYRAVNRVRKHLLLMGFDSPL